MHRLGGIIIILSSMVVMMSGCNLGNDATSDTPQVDADGNTPAPVITLTTTPTVGATRIVSPTATFTLTPLPTVPATTDDTDNSVAPIGARDDSTLTPNPGTTSPVPEVVFPTTFPDRYTTSALSTGNTLLVTYLVELNNPGVGRVFFIVNDPNGVEVERWFVSESLEETTEIPVETSGVYEILVGFERLSGFYSVEFGFR